MYVTIPLSLYKRNPDDLSSPPPEGPNSGYLVLQDEESTTTCCFGLCKNPAIRDLPFPQNKLLVVTSGSSHSSTSDPVYLIPAINHPLSSNIYYAIKPNRKHKGEAYASSTEEDMVTCCFCNRVKDVKPRPLDPADVYQQFKFSTGQNCGHSVLTAATSVASNGHPPLFLRTIGWSMYSTTPKNFSLGEAAGLDPRLRARLPDFDFPLSDKASKPVVVGKWYCPFMFIKDLTLKDQVKKSMFYEMTLEQLWERIFLNESDYGRSSQGNKTVMVDVTVHTESFTVAGTDAIQDDQENDGNLVVWFKSTDGRRDEARVGLSSLIVERMMWEEKRGGWIPNKEKQEKVSRTEEFGGIGASSTSGGCYMLVERFVLKRMDGTLLLTYSFNHTHKIRSKWA